MKNFRQKSFPSFRNKHELWLNGRMSLFLWQLPKNEAGIFKITFLIFDTDSVTFCLEQLCLFNLPTNKSIKSENEVSYITLTLINLDVYTMKCTSPLSMSDFTEQHFIEISVYSIMFSTLSNSSNACFSSALWRRSSSWFLVILKFIWVCVANLPFLDFFLQFAARLAPQILIHLQS